MEKWISQVVGKMHVNKITQIEVAKKMGVCNDYVSMILTGKKSPKDAKQRINEAIDAILSDRKNSVAE